MSKFLEGLKTAGRVIGGVPAGVVYSIDEMQQKKRYQMLDDEYAAVMDRMDMMQQQIDDLLEGSDEK